MTPDMPACADQSVLAGSDSARLFSPSAMAATDAEGLAEGEIIVGCMGASEYILAECRWILEGKSRCSPQPVAVTTPSKTTTASVRTDTAIGYLATT